MKKVLTAATAVAAALALSIGMSAPALAATDEFRPGVSSPSDTGNSSWHPTDAGVSLIAQTFTQPETGQVASFTFKLRDIASNNLFTAAALHTFDNATGPSPEPITGGVAQISLGDSVDNQIEALLTFPSRPTLQEGERYAVVFNPLLQEFDDEASVASFVNYFSWSPHDPNFVTWNVLNGVWEGYSTGQLIFSSQLVTAVATPEAPTLGTAECGVIPEVVLPDTEGVSYDVQQEGMSFLVTAEPVEGYELAVESDTSWTLEFTVNACELTPAQPVEPEDTEDTDNPGDEESDETEDSDEPILTEKDETEDDLVVQQKPVKDKDKLADTGVSFTGPVTVTLGLVLLGAGAFIATRSARAN